MNLYAYVHNNPLTHFDEYGLLDYGQYSPNWNQKSFFYDTKVGSVLRWAGSQAVHRLYNCVGTLGQEFERLPFFKSNFLNTEGLGYTPWAQRLPLGHQKIDNFFGTNWGSSFGKDDHILALELPFSGSLLSTSARVASVSRGAFPIVRSSASAVAKSEMASPSFVQNRFHQAAYNLSEVGQNNIRILRGWAKSKGWQKFPNPQGGPEKWGVYKNGNPEWRLILKPEPSLRPGLQCGSNQPRFDARLDIGGNYYINPFTNEMGNNNTGKHLLLDMQH